MLPLFVRKCLNYIYSKDRLEKHVFRRTRRMKSSVFSGKQAISPVIAAIILVTVTIAVAVSSTFYYTSVVGAYTDFETIEIRSVNVYPVSQLNRPTSNVFKGSGWNVSIMLKNTGTKQVTIKYLLLNSRLVDGYDRVAVFDGSGYVKTGNVSLTIPCQSSTYIFVAIKNGEDARSGIVFSPGLHLEVTLQSASGISYMQFMTLS
jgi:hypothetical protein